MSCEDPECSLCPIAAQVEKMQAEGVSFEIAMTLIVTVISAVYDVESNLQLINAQDMPTVGTVH